jgi:Pyridoxal-phosphate dependent enzyme
MSQQPERLRLNLDKPGRGRIYDSIAETIGNTPLVRIAKLAQAHDAREEIVLKLEFFNPIASVKDRIGVSMIAAMEAEGTIGPGAGRARCRPPPRDGGQADGSDHPVVRRALHHHGAVRGDVSAVPATRPAGRHLRSLPVPRARKPALLTAPPRAPASGAASPGRGWRTPSPRPASSRTARAAWRNPCRGPGASRTSACRP